MSEVDAAMQPGLVACYECGAKRHEENAVWCLDCGKDRCDDCSPVGSNQCRECRDRSDAENEEDDREQAKAAIAIALAHFTPDPDDSNASLVSRWLQFEEARKLIKEEVESIQQHFTNELRERGGIEHDGGFLYAKISKREVCKDNELALRAMVEKEGLAWSSPMAKISDCLAKGSAWKHGFIGSRYGDDFRIEHFETRLSGSPGNRVRKPANVPEEQRR